MSGEDHKVHLALIQFEGALCDRVGNTAHACELIARAGAAGADLVVLPELFSTGYQLNVVGPRIMELAEPVDGPTVTTLREAAREAGCYVIAGVALTYDLTGVPFNSAVVIDRGGELMGTYDKQHLWSLERFYFRGGSDAPVFDMDFGRVGVLICYDLGFPEVARSLTLQGADLLVCPSAWCEPDHDVWDIDTRCRALENTVFLAAVNRHGREEDLYMGGHTLVCNPRGTVVAEIAEEREEVLHVTVDLDDIATFRNTTPYLRDRHPELYDLTLLP